MKNSKLIRAWRNQDIRTSMEGAAKVANSAGVSELGEKLLGSIGGATGTVCSRTFSRPTHCTYCSN